jgi:hypothetical protein
MLGCFLEKKGELVEAVGCYKRAYEGAVDVLGSEHDDAREYEEDYARVLGQLYATSGEEPSQ